MNLFRKIIVHTMSQKSYQNYLRKKGVSIGENCEIYKSANFGSEPYLIYIGNHVRVSANVQLITHDGAMWVLRCKTIATYGTDFCDADKFGRIVINDNVHVGTNAIIMPGVTIGTNSIIACNAVVTHDVEPFTVVGGGTG